jgi:hypothetical protein
MHMHGTREEGRRANREDDALGKAIRMIIEWGIKTIRRCVVTLKLSRLRSLLKNEKPCAAECRKGRAIASSPIIGPGFRRQIYRASALSELLISSHNPPARPTVDHRQSKRIADNRETTRPKRRIGARSPSSEII